MQKYYCLCAFFSCSFPLFFLCCVGKNRGGGVGWPHKWYQTPRVVKDAGARLKSICQLLNALCVLLSRVIVLASCTQFHGAPAASYTQILEKPPVINVEAVVVLFCFYSHFFFVRLSCKVFLKDHYGEMMSVRHTVGFYAIKEGVHEQPCSFAFFVRRSSFFHSLQKSSFSYGAFEII